MNPKLNKILYPMIMVIFLAIAGIILFYSMRFFSKSIKDIFLIDETKIGSVKTIDIQNYNYVAPRIGIKELN